MLIWLSRYKYCISILIISILIIIYLLLLLLLCVCTHIVTHTHIHLQPPPSSTSSTIAFSMPPTHSTFPTTCSGTICASAPTTRHCKTSDSDQLAPKSPKTQGKAPDSNNDDADSNNDGTNSNKNLNDENLLPVKGGWGGHKARKQRNWEIRYIPYPTCKGDCRVGL